MPKKRRYTPQEKKRLSYEKDSYTRGGESLPAWRKAKPVKKRKAIHAFRRKLRMQLQKLEEEGDLGEAAGRRYGNPRQKKVEDWGVMRLKQFIKSRRARNQVGRTRVINLIAFAIGLALLASSSLVDARTWTSADGRTLEADLLEYDTTANTVRLRRADGKVFTLQTSKLSESDVAHLQTVEKEKKEALAKSKSQAGTTSSHASSGEHKVPYHVYFPKGYEGTTKLPMLILFSPNGRGKSLLNKFTEAADEMQWVLVGCDRLKNGMEAELGETLFTELLPEIEKTVVHDSETLYLGGFSGGGLRAFDYSAKFERPWKGIISCGGWLGGPAMWEREYPKGLAVAMVNGDDDKGASSWTEKDTAVLEKSKCKVREFEFPGGHTVGSPKVLLDAMKWIKQEQKK